MLSTKLKEAAGNGADATLYVDDVFSTWLYTGNNSTQTITNGIDLAGKGGLVWVKSRTNTYGHSLTNQVGKYLDSSDIGGMSDQSFISSFNSDGFSLGSGALSWNGSSNYASWTFRKAAKFFDVVTYTGTGSARTIAHSLGVAPGMVIVKRTDTTGDWQVYSNGLTSAAYSIQLNLTAAQASAPTVWNSTAPTSSVFSVGTDSTVNASGGTYVAYLYAHDTSSTGIIQCGSYVGNGTTNNISLGWESQYVLIKSTSGAKSWVIFDTMRGFCNSSLNNSNSLSPNTSTAEAPKYGPTPTSTGFGMGLGQGNLDYNGSGQTYIYMAIRRPNKPPTTGTQVFGLNARTGTGANATVTGGQVDDAVLIKNRGSAVGDLFASRLTGTGYLETSSTAAEVAAGTTILQANPWDVMDGVKVGTTSTITNASANTFINYLFKRAPGFFDVVCYTGTGGTASRNHNLTVTPEFIIARFRTGAAGDRWCVYHSALGVNNGLYLDTTDSALGSGFWGGISPTSTTFSSGSQVNVSAATYVAYLFATLAGISKVGSYTGNGSSQNIECGFAAGARFVLIKRTDSTGDWYVWDSARGIVSANDPHLSLNTTAAEVTTDDSVDPYSAGFAVNQVAATNINVSSATYIFLAIA